VEAGTVIFLNGASSSGKGTLARALQASLDRMFLHLEMDLVFASMESAGYNGAVQLGEVVPPRLSKGTAFIHDDWKFVRIEYGDDGRRAFRGFFSMVAGLAGERNDVIVDAFLTEPWMVTPAAASFGDLSAYLVGLHCPADELERRERERGDRFPGIARAFAETVHRYVPFYDVEVDTASSSIEQCVDAVRSRISSGEPRAFKALSADPVERAG
jgi:chloramphenicol 3-O phosphotransferase